MHRRWGDMYLVREGRTVPTYLPTRTLTWALLPAKTCDRPASCIVTLCTRETRQGLREARLGWAGLSRHLLCYDDGVCVRVVDVWRMLGAGG